VARTPHLNGVEPTVGEEAASSDLPGEVREPVDRYEAARPDAVATPTPGSLDSRRRALGRFLEESVWPRVPEDQLGARLDKREREAILGYGSDGV
jgi:hypothetical protein